MISGLFDVNLIPITIIVVVAVVVIIEDGVAGKLNAHFIQIFVFFFLVTTTTFRYKT